MLDLNGKNSIASEIARKEITSQVMLPFPLNLKNTNDSTHSRISGNILVPRDGPNFLDSRVFTFTCLQHAPKKLLDGIYECICSLNISTIAAANRSLCKAVSKGMCSATCVGELYEERRAAAEKYAMHRRRTTEKNRRKERLHRIHDTWRNSTACNLIQPLGS